MSDPDPADEADSLHERAMEDPESVEIDRLTPLLSHSDDAVRNTAVLALLHVAKVDPEAALRTSPELVEMLTTETDFLRKNVVNALSHYAQHDPGVVIPALPALVDLLAGSRLDEKTPAVVTVAAVSREHPEELAAHASELVTALDADPNPHPDDYLAGSGDRLPTLATEHAQQEFGKRDGLREGLAGILVDVASETPEALVDHVPELAEFLADENPAVRTAIVDVLAHIAFDRPEHVTPVVDGVIARLDDESPAVRMRSVRLLGLVNEESVLDRVRTIAAEDPHEDVRKAAAMTVEYLRS